MSKTLSGAGGAGMSRAGASAPTHQKMSTLYGNIDTGGSITQSQFNQAFQTLDPPAPFEAAGAGAVWNALDPNGTGQVSRQDFINGMKNLMVQLRQGGKSASGAAQTSAAVRAGPQQPR